MERVFDWSEPILGAAASMTQGFLEYLPQLMGGMALLVIGWLIARTLRALVRKILRSFDRLSAFLGLSNFIAIGRLNDAVVNIIGNIAFWLVILFFLTAAANLLGLTLFAGWLDTVIGHLPKLLSGVLIIFAGVVVGNLVNDSVRTASQNMPSRQRTLLARGAQAFTVATMIVIGIDQIGIDITILITVIAIAVAAFLGGLAFAFSLGSRTLVSNLIGARYLSKDYRIGELIRIGSAEGKILEVTPTTVVLDTTDGRVTIPAKIFGEETSVLLQQEAANVG